MSKFFIHRPIFAIVIALIIVIAGILSAFQLPIAQYPQISPPTISVSTTYVGANAKTVNEAVAQVIEQQVNGTQGMDYMSSNANDSGYYSLSVVFDLGTDGDMDAVKVQNNVAVANSSLPDSVKTMGVTTSKSSNSMAYMMAMYSPNGTFDRAWMKNYGDIYMLDKIKRVPGVGSVQVFGSSHSMRVWVNPAKMAESGITAAEIAAAIQEQNVQAPAGTVGAMPVPSNQEKQSTGKIDGRLVSIEDFENIILKANNDGQYIRLKDVAKVETGQQDYIVSGKFNNKSAVAYGIQLTNDANTMVTVAEVRKILDEVRQDFPPDLVLEEMVDSTNFIKASITEVVETFIEALILVVLVVFIFLQNWRATLIPLLAVPVSLIGTFVAFILLGFSINTLTLFAMVLAIGLVVDDAIVVIENVEAHMAKGLNPVEATEQAMDEVQGPVVAIAFVLAAVFVPVAFLGGMMGVLYRQFALTIAISMALSAFVALTLTPALCATMLKPHSPKDDEGVIGSAFKKFNDGFNKIRIRYQGIVGWFIGHAKYAFILLILVCGLTGLLYKTLPTTFVPEEDQGYYIVSVNLPEGTAANQTQKTMDKLSGALKEVNGVKNVMSINGFDIMSFGTKSSAGTMFVSLKDWTERTTPDLQVNTLIMKTFGVGAMVAPEARVIAFNTPSLPGLGTMGGWQMEVQDLTGHTDAELDEISKKIVAAANQRPELQGVRSSFTVNSPIYQYDIDREKVKSMGVSMADVFTAMQIFYGGSQINDYNEFGRTYKVVLQADEHFRSNVENLRFMYVRSNTGSMVPLESLLKPQETTGPSLVHRFNANKAITIQGNAGNGFSSGEAMKAAEEVARTVAPEGFGIDWSGQAREEHKSSDSTMQVLALALVFVFLCLAALYESWSIPFSVLLSVPVGVFGALFSEYLIGFLQALDGFPNAGLQNNIYMQIGVIMIIGLAAKNAILIVEFAKIRVDAGMNPLKAAIEAAGLRLRPILMTSFAFIIGCLPLAIATGAGAASRNAMGVAVVGGMLFATCISTFIIPAFYVVMEWIAEKAGIRKKAKKKTPTDFM